MPRLYPCGLGEGERNEPDSPFPPPPPSGYNPGMSEHPNSSRPRSVLRRLIAFPVLAAGLVVFANGVYLETRNPRSNDEDNIAICVLAVGASITGAGISIPFVRPLIVVLVAMASPVIAYALAVIVFWFFMPLVAVIWRLIRT
jgi:hypothetical protein